MNGSYRSRSKGTVLTAGVSNVVYTAPPKNTTKVVLLFIANKTAGNKTVTIKWHDAHNNLDYTIVGGYVVSAFNFLKFDQAYLVLNAGDYITVIPEAGADMDATVSVEEFYDPASQQ